MRANILFLMTLISIQATLSPTHANEPADGSVVRVISYNVQFLPGLGQLFNARGNSDYRAQRLGEVLAKYDIIGLQEVFERTPRERILDTIKSVWGDSFHVSVCPEPGPEVGRYNAGLAIVSRFPILASHHHTYSVTSTKEQFGVFADEFAAKGCHHARVRVRPEPTPVDVDVFVTHLDARLASVRQQQMTELRDFALEHASAQNPIVLLGDFNTRGNTSDQADPDSDYRKMMKIFQGIRPTLVDTWPTLESSEGGTSDQDKADGGKRIDYVFHAPLESSAESWRAKSIAVERFLDPKVEFLSDHSAVQADFLTADP